MNVLMVGAGEYNVGYVPTAAGAAADKRCGVTAICLFDMRRRGMVNRILLADADGTRLPLAPMSVVTATKLAPLERFVPAFDEAATPEALRALEQDPFNDDGATKRTLRAIARFDDIRLSWDVIRLFMMNCCMLGLAKVKAMPSTTTVIISSIIVNPAAFFMSWSIETDGANFTARSRER
jgi:hypothetical protein